MLVLSGDTPLLTTGSARGAARRPTAALAPAPPCSRSSRPTSARYGRILRGGDGTVEAIVEAGDATPEQLELAAVQLLDLRLPRRPALAGARPAPARQRAGRALPHRRGARPRRGRRARRRARRRRPGRDRRREHARRARRRGRAAARPHQPRAHARRRRDRRPGLDLDRAGRRARAGRRRAPVHRPARRARASPRARRSARMPSRSTRRSEPARWSGPSVTFARARFSRRGAKAGTFVEIKNSRIGEGTKVPHLSLHRRRGDRRGNRTSARATITANFPHQPGRPKGRTTIGRNVRDRGRH